MLTRSSVVWADRIVATSSWNGLSCCRAHRSRALPGYSSARRATVSRARPLGVLGIPTERRYAYCSLGNACSQLAEAGILLTIASTECSVTARRTPVREHSPTPMTEGFDVPHRHRGRARLLPCIAVRRSGAGVRSHHLDQPRRYAASDGPESDRRG